MQRIIIPAAMEVGKLIAKARKQAGLSQPELSEKCGWGYKQARISHYETGRNMPGIDDLETMCKVFKISLADLFSLEGKPAEASKSPTTSKRRGLAEKIAALPPGRQKLIVQLIEELQ
jgi:transcriptional regulator with XRE-family HTH domain